MVWYNLYRKMLAGIVFIHFDGVMDIFFTSRHTGHIFRNLQFAHGKNTIYLDFLKNYRFRHTNLKHGREL
jgi:hypothetical protein